MLKQKAGAAVQPATPWCGNINTIQNTTRQIARSSVNLKDQLGLLLWQLQTPLSKHQSKAGWCLFGILLTQYVTIRGEAL